jgi:hypothetical protein
MKTAALNARLPVGLKRAVDRFCAERGLKVQAFVESLIQERLEDELDARLIDERRDEKTVPFDVLLRRLGEPAGR